MTPNKILQEDFEFIHSHYDFGFLYGKTVFVTGATGLIGKQLCLYFLFLNETDDATIKIFALVRDIQKANKVFGDNAQNSSLCFVKGDVLLLPKIDEKIDFVIHGASITQSKIFVQNPVETIDVAVNGTMNVLQFAKDKNVAGAVYLSSMEVFGTTSGECEVKENDLGYIDILNPRSSYSQSKRLCECLAASFASEFSLPVKIARLTQTLGPGISYNDTRVAAQFARAVMKNNDIVLKTEGKTKRPIVYTRDAISAILKILEKGENGRAYTVANPKTFLTIKETAQMIAQKIAGGKIKVVFDINVPAEYAPNLNLNLNIDAVCSLGWLPSVGLEEAYRRMIEGMGGEK